MGKWKLLGMLFAQNTSAAYIAPETRATMVIQHKEMRDDNGDPLFNMIKNILSKLCSICMNERVV